MTKIQLLTSDEANFLLKNGSADDKQALFIYLLKQFFLNNNEILYINDVIELDENWWKKLSDIIPEIAKSKKSHLLTTFINSYSADLKVLCALTEHLTSHKQHIHGDIISDMFIFANCKVDKIDADDFFLVVSRLITAGNTRFINFALDMCKTFNECVPTTKLENNASKNFPDGLMAFAEKALFVPEINPCIVVKIFEFFAKQDPENAELLQSLALRHLEKSNFFSHQEQMEKFVSFKPCIFNSEKWVLKAIKVLAEKNAINIENVFANSRFNSLLASHTQDVFNILLGCTSGRNKDKAMVLMFRALEYRPYLFPVELRCQMLKFINFGLPAIFTTLEAKRILDIAIYYLPEDEVWSEKISQIVEKSACTWSDNSFIEKSALPEKFKKLFDEEIRKSSESAENKQMLIDNIRAKLVL